MDLSASQEQETPDELETHKKDNSRDIGYSDNLDSNHGGSVDSDYSRTMDSNHHGRSVNGGLNEGEGYSNSYGYVLSTGYDNGGSDNNDDYDGRNMTKIPNRRSSHRKSTPVLDEYRSEPEQYSQQDGELSASAIQILVLDNSMQRKRTR